MISKDTSEISIENEFADTDFIVHKIDIHPDSIIFGLYSKLNAYEHHFQYLQGKYRTIAVTWLLGAFMGLGYFFSIDPNIPLSNWGASVVIAFAGIVGITAFWQLELFVYQTALQSILIEEVSLEKKYSFFPKTRTNMMLMKERQKTRYYQSSFYVTCNGILMLLICAFTFFELYPKNPSITLLIISLMIANFSALLYYMIRVTEKINKQWKKMGNQYKVSPKKS